ncbi:Uncharacterised protein [Cedecea lapagei]|uniref:Uncharacterized protein n=1 Tax=Cedecea lapagei TaxID=158823 RepID=A0A3S4IQ51_9ENTR|nr:Uncharacterised protein [Cedecea lapagei]
MSGICPDENPTSLVEEEPRPRLPLAASGVVAPVPPLLTVRGAVLPDLSWTPHAPPLAINNSSNPLGDEIELNAPGVLLSTDDTDWTPSALRAPAVLVSPVPPFEIGRIFSVATLPIPRELLADDASVEPVPPLFTGMMFSVAVDPRPRFDLATSGVIAPVPPLMIANGEG